LISGQDPTRCFQGSGESEEEEEEEEEAMV
jgi:hypothetical protein